MDRFIRSGDAQQKEAAYDELKTEVDSLLGEARKDALARIDQRKKTIRNSLLTIQHNNFH